MMFPLNKKNTALMMPLLLILIVMLSTNGCLSFTVPKNHHHQRHTWLTRRSLYVDQDHAPNVVVPEVLPRVPQRHSLIKEWIPRPPPSYMPRNDEVRDNNDDNNNTRHSQNTVDHLFDQYVTVSQQEECDAHELKPKLERTAPTQPAAPSQQEMAYATLKHVLVDNQRHYSSNNLAAPVDFDMYMTVTDDDESSNNGIVVPPTDFVEAVIEETPQDLQQEETTHQTRNEERTPWNDYFAASIQEDEYTTNYADATNNNNHASAPTTSVDSARQLKNYFAQQWREKYFSPDQPTMKELAAEYYWNQERLHEQQQIYQQKKKQPWQPPASSKNPFSTDWMHSFNKFAKKNRDMGYYQQG